MQVTTPINEGLSVSRRGVGVALIAVALAVVTAVGLAVVASPAPETAVEVDLTSGFEHSAEATAGKVAGAGITAQYFGHSGELYPETSAPSVPDQATIDLLAPAPPVEWFEGTSTSARSEWFDEPASEWNQ